MYIRNAQGWSKHLDFIIIDEICLQIAFVLAVLVRVHAFAYQSMEYRLYAVVLFLVDAVVPILLNSFHNVLKRGYGKEMVITIKHCILVFATMTVFMFSVQTGSVYSRVTLYLAMLFHVIIGYCGRTFWKIFLKRIGENRKKNRRMLLVLEESTAISMIHRLQDNASGDIQIAGIVLNANSSKKEICSIPVVATLSNAAEYICREWIDEVYIDCSAADPQIAKLMDECSVMGVPVHYHVPAVSSEGVKRFAEKIGGTTVLTTSINYQTFSQMLVKRLFDILGGIVGSIFALIIMMVIGPIIKAKSPGPILYKQTRVGYNGKPFKIFKLRSMYMDADKRKKELMAQNRVKDGMMFKLDFDPRIIGNEILPDGTKKTGIGEFIRKTSLDEFPQFFNVLFGQMSLVGTRPPTMDEWEKYELHHRARMSAKPGITGMWQVSGRSNITDFNAVVHLDTEYILNWSYGMDIKILIKTVFSVLLRKGAM